MLRTILSPILVILTVVLIPSVNKALFFLPLIFALAVALTNLSALKTKTAFTGILLAIAQTYGVFLGLAIVLFYLDEFSEGMELLNHDANALRGILLVTIGGYLAALLLFFFSTFIYKIRSRQFGYVVISFCYALIVLVMQLFSKNEFLQFGVEKFASFLISWVIFMSLGFSTAINRDSLYTRFAKKQGKQTNN